MDQAADARGRHLGGSLASMPMLRILLAAYLLVPVLASAQTADSLVTLPGFAIPIRGDFAPPQTSAARAYLYSAAATGGLVVLGIVVDRVARNAIDETRSSSSLLDAGPVLIAVGLGMGPSVGNISLGAGTAVRRATMPKLVCAAAGGVLVLASIGSLVPCAVNGPCPEGSGVVTIATAGFVVIGAGVLVGTVVDLATIPANARWAQRARSNGNRVPAPQVRVSVAPGYDPRFDAPMATVRVAL